MHTTTARSRWQALLPLLGLTSLLLTGCPLMDGDNDDLQAWMMQERANARPRVQPLAAPKTFVPKDYAVSSTIHPFDSLKLISVLRSATRSNDTRLIDAELNRRKEPLESIPLDSIAMVGSLDKSGTPTALVKVDNLLYQIHLGNYLGPNYGKVTNITETSIQLREIVQDSSGDWVERSSTLNLKEETL